MKAERKQFSLGKRVRFRFEYAALRFLEWLIPHFSRRFVQRLGHALGALAWRISPELRRISLQNLALAFGDRPQNAAIGRTSMQNVAATVLTLFWNSRVDRTKYHELIEINPESVETIRQLHGRGKGVIAFTCHFGDWELLGMTIGFLIYPMTVVQEAMHNESLESIFARLRGVSGNKPIPNRFAGTALLKALKRGGFIALLIDQNATRRRGGVWLDFFGLPTFSTAAPALLAEHTGAAVLAGVAIPLRNGRVRLEFHEIQRDPLATLNQRCLAYCEQAIRDYPECWMWSYKRWTPRATPEQGRYPDYSRYWPDLVEKQ